MEISVLGPLEVRAGGRALPLGGVKPRGLLAFLLLHAGEPVSADRLAVALWGDDAPAGAPNTVQVYVSRLRSALGDDGVLITTPAGYRAHVLPDQLDADRFGRLVADGRRMLADRQPERAAALLEEALALWRGPPLADLASLPFAPTEIARLEEQRLEAIELHVHAGLDAGRHAELVAELRRLTRAHPWPHDPELAAPAREGPADGLPVPPDPTIGREHELRAIAERLGSARLVTLTGPGGVGKTRLAVEAARAAESAYPDGALFVPRQLRARARDRPVRRPDPGVLSTRHGARHEPRATGAAGDPALDLGDRSAVADICRRVDGLPLAVELAAAGGAALEWEDAIACGFED